jgi:hypothetical protein
VHRPDDPHRRGGVPPRLLFRSRLRDRSRLRFRCIWRHKAERSPQSPARAEAAGRKEELTELTTWCLRKGPQCAAFATTLYRHDERPPPPHGRATRFTFVKIAATGNLHRQG